MTGLFDKFADLAERRRGVLAAGTNPFGVRMERMLSATEAIIDGRRTLLVGTNNYLGLSFEPECIEAAIGAAREEGIGTTGSRVANGTYAGHQAVEDRIAGLFGRRGAILFSTGYQANLGVLSGLCGPKDVILLDADSHACIYDGARLSGATVIRFRHNDPADLDKRLRRLELPEGGHALVVIEGLYSMLGDRAPIAEFVEVKRRHGAALMVDEAHSFGVMGERGRGAAEADGCGDDVDLIVGTFSKSVGTVGGFCVSDHPGLDMLRYASRPYVFTASLPPPVVASALAALDRIDEGDDLRMRLWANVERLWGGLRAAGLELAAPPGPVIAVKQPGAEALLMFWNRLLQRGIYVNLAMPPGTPQGVHLLRCSVSAAHSAEQIDQVCATFAAVAAELGGA